MKKIIAIVVAVMVVVGTAASVVAVLGSKASVEPTPIENRAYTVSELEKVNKNNAGNSEENQL